MSDNKISIREIKIGVTHTISFGNFENMKVTAEIAFGIPPDSDNNQLTAYTKDAQARLKQLLQQTYLTQKPKHKQPVDTQSSPTEPQS